MKNRRLVIVFFTVATLLFIPYIAMQFDSGVNWDIRDFAVMGTLLLGTGLLCEFVLRKVGNFKNRIIICSVILCLFLLIWAELAVGVLGTPFAGS